MKRYPDLPSLDESPEVLERGHLWIQELVDGPQVRFRLREDGRIALGDRTRSFQDDVPLELRFAARHVERRLDREALRSAVDDVEAYVFFGVATHRRRIDYDWDRIPPVLGFDVWDGSREEFRPPDAVSGIFERLGLSPVNALRKEVNTRDFAPDRFEVPGSAWYDGPARGVVVRNKRGGRAMLEHPEFPDGDPFEAFDPDRYDAVPDIVDAFATDDRIARARAEAADPDAAFERVFDLVVRAAHPWIFRRETAVDPRELRSAVASRVHQFQG